jgi:hypothetical protein
MLGVSGQPTPETARLIYYSTVVSYRIEAIPPVAICPGAARLHRI